MRSLTILLLLLATLSANVIEEIKLHEGFVSKPYKDGHSYSIGYGTQLPITKHEATLLLVHRLAITETTLKRTYPWYNKLPVRIKHILLNMAYNTGTRGFSKFRKMHTQLSRHNWVKAAIEMRSSLWYKQTKSRSKYLYNLMVNYKD